MGPEGIKKNLELGRSLSEIKLPSIASVLNQTSFTMYVYDKFNK
jgi:hypothetical protein